MIEISYANYSKDHDGDFNDFAFSKFLDFVLATCYVVFGIFASISFYFFFKHVILPGVT